MTLPKAYHMNKTTYNIIILTVIIFLNGCCYNQYERKGYSVGLDCITPSKGADKSCGHNNDESCDEKVQKVKKSIEAPQK
jgi:hypothetical protein